MKKYVILISFLFISIVTFGQISGTVPGINRSAEADSVYLEYRKKAKGAAPTIVMKPDISFFEDGEWSGQYTEAYLSLKDTCSKYASLSMKLKLNKNTLSGKAKWKFIPKLFSGREHEGEIEGSISNEGAVNFYLKLPYNYNVYFTGRWIEDNRGKQMMFGYLTEDVRRLTLHGGTWVMKKD